MGCTACHEQHAGSADRHRHWTQQNDYTTSRRNAEGSTPFFEITVLPALTITHPAIFRKKKSIWEQCRSLCHIYLKPRQRRKKRHYQFFHVLEMYIKHNVLHLVNIIKHNLFRRIFICFRLGDHTAQVGLGEPGPSQRKSLACSFVLDIHQGKKSYPFFKSTTDMGCWPLPPS